MEIKEKLLKDSYERTAPLSMDVTKVVVDTRSPTHDIVKVTVRMMPAGQLVTDKTDSITIARRLIPDTLRYDKEPSTTTADFEHLAEAYFDLLVSARTAVSCRDVSPIVNLLRKGGDAFFMGLPADLRQRVANRALGHKDVSTELDLTQPVPLSD